ncbi:YesN/AraC family two-component response regulator [Gracilibacillus halotolerans]|uniref:YesN/AraC family two-component response regulator n=1 Tax=Gracilibacillus halotolerans TaxID=74386 RepID=A0A841RPG5_9BACI|nr:response regulator [Gracilibacillus halotolerans]MBB6512548.1 YesN/AraC family two-component response regulator [Gracilibacillus halotolerans]
MQRKVILIVDDEPRSREGIKKTIEKESLGKYDVFTASNAKEALDKMDGGKVHVLITDIKMPEMTGLDLLKELRLQAKDPVVIIISAYSEFDYAHQALELGVVNYLLKPIPKKKLMDAVEKAIAIDEDKTRKGLMNKIVDDTLLQANQISTMNKSVQEVLDYVEDHFYEDISLKGMAEIVHLNASYLSSLFKEEVEMTFSEYLTRRRLQEAKKLLMQTDLTVNEIAEKVGYQTAKYFIKLFKQYEKATPSSYRKMM